MMAAHPALAHQASPFGFVGRRYRDDALAISVIRRIFWMTFITRVCLWLVLFAVAQTGSFDKISGDISDYQYRGEMIAEQYRNGEIDWSQWLDEGWFQAFGVAYAIFGIFAVNMLVLFSCVLCGLAAVLIYRVGRIAFDDHRIGAAAGICFAFHPGAIFFQALPLKEGIAVFGIMSAIWGLVQINRFRTPVGWAWLILGLSIMAMIRIYLIPIALYACILSLAPIPARTGWGYLFTITLYLVVLAFIGINMLKWMNVDLTQYEMLRYFDIDRLNQTRASLVRGDAAMYGSEEDAMLGENWFYNAYLIGRGVFFFIIGVDLTNLRSPRQIAAAPEGILVVICLPLLFRGIMMSLKRGFKIRMPIVIFLFALALVYGGATTNIGAMYRWRLQALPMGLLLIFAGASSKRAGFVYRFMRKYERRAIAIQQAAISRGTLPQAPVPSRRGVHV